MLKPLAGSILDCERIRADFPSLREGLVFLDSAASTLKPVQVVEAMSSFALERYANVHRGAYRLSVEATRAYEEAREVVASFIGALPEEVVFTYNATDALNRVALALALNRVVVGGDEIIVTEAEHNSNLLPWFNLSRLTGATLKIVPVDERGVPRWDRLLSSITGRTRLVAVGHVSNVTGAVAPVREIAREARRVGALLVVDGAQSVPHMPVDVRELGADFLAFSGHKMLGPTGIGVLWARRDLLEELDPPVAGGGTVRDVSSQAGALTVVWEDPPAKFEAGTPPVIEAVGLRAAVEYLAGIGMERVEAHERALARELAKALEDLGARVIGPPPGERSGIVSFTIPGVDPDAVGARLSAKGIAVRTGLHCAYLLHKRLGLHRGTVRASLYIYNCPRDVEKLVEAVREIMGSSRPPAP